MPPLRTVRYIRMLYLEFVLIRVWLSMFFKIIGLIIAEVSGDNTFKSLDIYTGYNYGHNRFLLLFSLL
ncbi:MAG: hypothetical protein ACP5QK_02150 [Myxococcota bacterium]